MAISFPTLGTQDDSNGTSPLSPGLPASLALGDVMVCIAYSREAVDGSMSISAGWTEIFASAATAGGTMYMWGRVWASGDAGPTVTLTNHATGASGDTAMARIVRVAGAEDAQVVDFVHQTTARTQIASAQNIGALTLGISIPPEYAGFVFGGKRDDWTSVATLSGDNLTWAELSEVDSGLGADGGLVFNSFINETASTQTLTDKTFTVTGGAAATSMGGAVVFRPSSQTRNRFYRGVTLPPPPIRISSAGV